MLLKGKLSTRVLVAQRDYTINDGGIKLSTFYVKRILMDRGSM